jgi:2-succinyl-5-enolpyruvyl-6-hydroxy-3-cyclohexene-1-carboxylate synthase
VFIVGGGAGDPEAVHELASRLGWPVLADARSGARLDRPTTVAAADAILRDPATAALLRPEVVIRLGAPWASKVVSQWLAASRAEQVLVDVNGAWWDPDRTAEFVWRGRPDAFCRAEEWADASAAPPDWLAAWQSAEGAAQAVMDVALSGTDGQLDDPTIARALTREMPLGSTLVTAASMPMREVEWYGVRRDGLRVLANRGANGIDGVTSTVLGVAAADASVLVVGLLGDLAFLHDSTALLTAAGGRIDALLVVVDNHGGAIFEFLPQAAALDRARFEQLFGTPQHADLVALAAAYGVAATEVSSVAELADAIKKYAYESGTRVIYARTDRTKTVAVHEALHAEVAGAVAAALDGFDLD